VSKSLYGKTKSYWINNKMGTRTISFGVKSFQDFEIFVRFCDMVERCMMYALSVRRGSVRRES
jgi:hypothetical protein